MDRFSPLYCAYNGFLLGQFLSLSFADYGRAEYPVRRARMLEFLREVDVTVELPEEPFAVGSEGQLGLLDTVVPQLQARARPLAAYTLLGTLLTTYGIVFEADPETARECLAEAEEIRAELGLPAIEPSRFAVVQDRAIVEETLSPSLVYLAEIVDGLAVEPDTAFVIMPFSDPYAGYFSTLYRPSLEGAGFRAFRAWGGLGSEDYATLLLKLIATSGMVWADVSEPNSNVFYEVGAAHALGKQSMLVVNEDRAGRTPANIGHDAVVRYSPDAEEWPSGTVAVMSMLIAAIRAAAEAGERLRVTPDAVSAALDRAADTALLERAMSHIAEGRYADAEPFLDGLLASSTAADAVRGAAAQFRGIARELRDDLGGALADYRLAIELGNDDAGVFLGCARALIAGGELDAARDSIEQARGAGADAARLDALEGDVLSAEGRFEEAVAAYDRSLALAEDAIGEFDRALALLLGGRTDDAIAGYRRGGAIADDDDRRYALNELDRRAGGHPGAAACRQALKAAS